MKTDLLAQIAEAQMVLVGIGREVETDYRKMRKEGYATLLDQAEEKSAKECDAIKQYLQCHYLKTHPDLHKKEMYEKLSDLLRGKNYFVVSICTDGLIYDSSLDKERIVTPCGGFRCLQCPGECDASCVCPDGQKGIDRVMRELDECRGGLSSVSFPRCEKCGSILFFNQVKTPGYCESEYLPQWEKYTKWLSGTLNKQLCILELGAGMEYPTVIRFPFEKVAFFNQKAHLFRVHSRLYQLTEELKGKGTAIQADPVEWICTLAGPE